ncbi:MAG: hypothetical protein CML73_01470 [Rhodobiaceae bacterium]|nr:hypothetical protein [Rhodobiaceae bacterium]
MENQNPPCKFCQRTRLFVALALLAFVLFSVQPESNFLEGVDITSAFTWMLLASVGVLVCWKAYGEYWK